MVKIPAQTTAQPSWELARVIPALLTFNVKGVMRDTKATQEQISLYLERTKCTFRLHNARQCFQLSHLSSPQTSCLHALGSLCLKSVIYSIVYFRVLRYFILEQTDYTPEEPSCFMVTYEIIILKAISTSARASSIGIKHTLGQAQQGDSNFQDFTKIK